MTGVAEWAGVLGGAFALGLLGSGHCLGMCGGIAGALGLAVRGPEGTALRGAEWLFSAGRVLSYGVLGALLGSFGDAVQHVFGSGWGFRVAAGAMVVLFGLQTMGLRLGGDRLEKLGLRVWRPLSAFGRRVSPRSPVARALFLGGLWGFLPCGLVYAAGAASLATGSAATGALFMVAFGLGTLPALVLATSAATRLRSGEGGTARRRFAGALLVVLGAWAIWAGLPGAHGDHDAHGGDPPPAHHAHGGHA